MNIQCGQSSPSQRWGADLRAHCSVKLSMTLKMGLERSQLFPEIFEIVLRPILWVAGSEQPSPPLHPPKVGGLLSIFNLYNTIWLLSLSSHVMNTMLGSVARRPSVGEEVGRVARFQPPTKLVVAQFWIFQATPGTFLSMFWVFFWRSVMQSCQWFAPPSWARLDCRHCTIFLNQNYFRQKYLDVCS